MYTKGHSEKFILEHMLLVEAVSFPFLILYYILQRYYLKENIAEKKEQKGLEKSEAMEMFTVE